MDVLQIKGLINCFNLQELKHGVQMKVNEVLQKTDEDRCKTLKIIEQLAKDLSD